MMYVVSTPIGNLEDITLRALRVLKECDYILCEDTRQTKKLLSKYEINTAVISYHEHSDNKKIEEIISLLENGNKVALVTDAGTPAISDPGAFLIRSIRSKIPDIKIESVPGASALTAAISVSGVDCREFVFLGFLPHKKGRQTIFKQIVDCDRPVIFYESTHRVMRTLASLKNFTNKRVVIVKELTKIFENVLSGSAIDLIEKFTADSSLIKGEFVFIVAPR